MFQKFVLTFGVDWDVPGSPFSLVEFQNQLNKKKEMERKAEMKIMEQQFMLSIPAVRHVDTSYKLRLLFFWGRSLCSVGCPCKD